MFPYHDQGRRRRARRRDGAHGGGAGLAVAAQVKKMIAKFASGS
jgi:hypothetical protein